MGAPAFSVVIPAYNGAATIERAIRSVLEQTHAPREIIVVDDGSTDATATVVARFGAAIRYLHQANAGVSAARNAGARHATADWLAFLDADDWYYPDRLRWHAQWIARDPSLDFLTGDYDYRRPDGALISRSMEITEAGVRLLRRAQGAPEVVMQAEEMALFVENHFGDTHTLSLPRSTFAALGGYPVGRAVCEDVNFLIRLCAISKRVGVVCKPMGVYLIHSGSATRSDPLRAQRLTVEALVPLTHLLADAPTLVRKGLRGRLRRARLNLAYALIRRGERAQALSAVISTLLHDPSMAALRDVASIARGCFQGTSLQEGGMH